ncbi:MAG TPA: Uma2 family endonuclease [Xenococcaceae cyanobacterium]|jgi:Uma2 family endonuclease
MSVTTYKWTLEQWHQLVETGVLARQNVEFIEGEIVEMSPEGIPHSFSNESIGNYLRKLLGEVAIVRERYPITLDNSEPQPDITIVRHPRDIYRTHHPYPEDIYLLIEISNSTLKFDLSTKAALYARNQISEYWIVDLLNKKLIVHTHPTGNGYSRIDEYRSGTIFCSSFPNIDITLDRLLL